MKTDRISLLKRIPIFAGLDEEALQALAYRSRQQKLKAQHTLFLRGEPGYTLYLIISGYVNIQTDTESGKTVHLALRGPGEHFGELSLLDGEPRMADAVTAEPCELLMLDRVEFVRCIEEKPRIGINIMACLAERLREAAGQMESHQGLDVLGRISEELLELLKLHGVDHPKGGKLIDTKVTHQALATRIGSTRETVSRALARLRSSRIIRNEGREIVVLDTKKLEQNCGR